MTDPGVGQFVAGPSPLGDRNHQSTATQTGQVVRHGLTGHSREVGEIRGVGGAVPQRQQHPGSGVVGQCVTEPCQGICPG